MGERENPVTAPQQPPPHPTKQAKNPALTSGNVAGTRVLLYAFVGSLAGGEAEANWADVLAHNTAGTVTTGALLVGFLVVLAVMWRHDRKRGRFGGEQ